MKIRPLMFSVLFVSFLVTGCIDVGTNPGPTAEADTSEPEPTAETCEADQNLAYRCSELPDEEVQICKETASGTYVWDTIDFCDEGEGCLENPLNTYPMCSPKYACFDVVQNLVSCDSAPELAGSASDRNDCRSAVQRLAIDDSYKELYDCYYGNRCEESSDVFSCLITTCPETLATCYHSADDVEVESTPGGTPDPNVTDSGSGTAGGEEEGSDAEMQRASMPEEDAAGVDAQEDEATPPDTTENPPDDRGGKVDGELVDPMCVDVWTCVASCGETCRKSCQGEDNGPVTDYDSETCQQACFPECRADCCADTSLEDTLSFVAGVNCIESSCSDVDSGEVQSCLWQQCPHVFSHCFIGGEGEASCKDTFSCLLTATENNMTDLTMCNANAQGDIFMSAMALMTCVGQATLPGEACEWVDESWAQHVVKSAPCLAEACPAEYLACPIPY